MERTHLMDDLASNLKRLRREAGPRTAADLAAAWDEGYYRGVRDGFDETPDPADNPYRGTPIGEPLKLTPLEVLQLERELDAPDEPHQQ